MPYKDKEKEKETKRRYRLAHREQLLDRRHRYYLIHREKTLEHNNQYNLAHRGQKSEYDHQYNLLHREQIKEYKHQRNLMYPDLRKKYYLLHREKILEHNNQYNLAHREYLAECRRQRYMARKKLGLCTKCSDKALLGMTQCENHILIEAERDRIFYNTNRPLKLLQAKHRREKLAIQHRCLCGRSLASEGGKYCYVCSTDERIPWLQKRRLKADEFTYGKMVILNKAKEEESINEAHYSKVA